MKHSPVEVALGLVVLAIAGFVMEYWEIAIALGVLGCLWFMYVGWRNSSPQKERRERMRTEQMYRAVLAQQGIDPEQDSEARLMAWLQTIYSGMGDAPESVSEELLQAAAALYAEEDFDQSVSPPPVICNGLEGAKYRDYLSQFSTRAGNPNAARIAGVTIKESFRDFLDALPRFEQADGDLWGSLTLADTGDLREAVQALASPYYRGDADSHYLFKRLKTTLDRNLCEASGLAYSSENLFSDRLVMPVEGEPLDVVERYLKGTPFQAIADAELPFHVPRDVRWEHTMITAGSGHGKTTLLSTMILEDINRAIAGEGGFAVIDPKGALIDSIAKLECFAPDTGALADRLLVIDPKRDVEYPPAINMFDLAIDDENLSVADRLGVRNNALELIDYLLTDLLDIGMTGRQQVGFNYVGDLLMQIDGATIMTLLEFLEDPESFEEHIAKCDQTTQNYLRSRFLSSSFKSVRDQLSDRVYGLLKLPMMEAMFSHAKTKIDIQAAVNEGKIVLIKADEDFLSTTGSKLFGGVWIALLFQACLARVAIPREERLGFTLYVDEASNFFSNKLRQLLIKAREYKLGVVFAFQDMEMIELPQLRASVLGSTSTKFVGGLNASDRRALAAEMNTTESYLKTPRKRMQVRSTEFACFVRGVTETPIMLSYELGRIDREPKMSDSDYDALIQTNRSRVSWVEPATDCLEAESTESELDPEEGYDVEEGDGVVEAVIDAPSTPISMVPIEGKPTINPEPPTSDPPTITPSTSPPKPVTSKRKRQPPKSIGPKEEGSDFHVPSEGSRGFDTNFSYEETPK